MIPLVLSSDLDHQDSVQPTVEEFQSRCNLLKSRSINGENFLAIKVLMFSIKLLLLFSPNFIVKLNHGLLICSQDKPKCDNLSLIFGVTHPILCVNNGLLMFVGGATSPPDHLIMLAATFFELIMKKQKQSHIFTQSFVVKS